MSIYYLPEHPGRWFKGLDIGYYLFGKPESGCHLSGVLSGSAVAVNLTHPEIYLLIFGQLAHLADTVGAVGVYADAVYGGTGIRG